jgi:hypothetical protein
MVFFRRRCFGGYNAKEIGRMKTIKKLALFPEYQVADDNGHEYTIIDDDLDVESVDDEQDSTKITAATILKTLPSDVTLIVQNNAYTLEVLESYKQIISDQMRAILQTEGHRSPNFRRYGEILRNITTAIKLKPTLSATCSAS